MKIQKQWFTNLRHKCSEKFRKFHWKTIALESLLNKVAGPDERNFIKKRLQHRCFPLKFAKFLRTSFSKYTSDIHLPLRIIKSDNLFKDFSTTSPTHNKSLITCNSHNDKLI